ncbi:MAG: hypothetical protein QOG20_1970 [Pseudonocardiales bacterium]|nr:hypothetical protein [Pseudonocardiales bacterium]
MDGVRRPRQLHRLGHVHLDAAGRFVLGADGRASLVASPIDPDPSVLNAAESCPAEAITVTAVDTGTVLAGPV